MMKEKTEPLDLTQMTDDEIRYIGIKFLKDIIKVLEVHEPFYMTQQKFRYLSGTLICAKQQLKQEEQEAA